MRRAKKIILFTFIILLSLVVILVVVAALSQNKIAKIAISQISETTNISIKIDDIDFSLVRNFPYATIKCSDLQVSYPDSIGYSSSDTLANVGHLYISVDMLPLLDGKFNIRKVELENAKLFYFVDSSGVSNINFLSDTTGQSTVDTSATDIDLNINDVVIKNTICCYNDKKLKASANLLINDLDFSGSMNHSKYSGKAKGQAVISNCSFDTTNISLMQQASINFSAIYNNDTLSFSETGVAIDEDANVELNGFVFLGDTMSTKMTILAQKLNIKGLLKYVPANMLKEYGISNLSGNLTAEANISGNLSDSVMPYANIDFSLAKGNLQYQDYPALSNIVIKGNATNGSKKNNSTTSLKINQFSFKSGNSTVNLSGTVKNPDALTYNLTSDINLDLQDIEAFVPDTFVQSIAGNVKVNLSTTGTLPDSITEQFIRKAMDNSQANIELEKLNIIIDSTLSVSELSAGVEYNSNKITINNLTSGAIYNDMVIDDISTSGTINTNYTSLDSVAVKLNKLKVAIGSSNVELNGEIKNLSAPDYSISGNFSVNMNDIKKAIPDSLNLSLAGNLSASFASAAKLNLDSIASQINSIVFEKSKFNIECKKFSVGMPDSIMCVSNVTGKVAYDYDKLEIPNLTANYFGMNIGARSFVAQNIYSAVILNQAKQLAVNGNFSVDSLDYALIDRLFLQEDSTATRDTEEEREPQNYSYKVNGNMKADWVKYEDAEITNIDSKFLVKENYYVFDSLYLNAFDGSSLTSLKIEMSKNNKMDVCFKTDIEKMDVSRFMVAFGKYVEYEGITSENIQGVLSTQMDGEIVLKDFEPDYNALMLKGDLILENGALINVKPVMEVENIKILGLKNMDNLHFNTINSSLFMFKNKLYIPRTEIQSTSLDAMFLGMYSFNGDYDYHIRVYLGEVLSSKSKSNLKKMMEDNGFEDEDEKEVTKGRTRVYVVSKSIDGEEKAGLDKKKDRKNMKAQVNLQEQMVNMRFHPALIKYNTEE